jgi:polysaccharide biosynthesis protein PslF
VPISTVDQPAQAGFDITTRPRRTAIGMLSTYPPTQCGLATFSAALVGHLRALAVPVGVVRVLDGAEPPSGPDVVAHLVNGSADSAVAAVRRLNGFDAVIVQHEYGIYGGPDGVDVLRIVDALTVPTIIVLHTVLQDPTDGQRAILLRLLAAADVVVTMTETAGRRLVASYGADPAQLVVIPHGAVEHRPRFAGTRPAADRPAADRPVVLTWGLLGPGKGIEWAIDAMVGLRDLRPRYLVMGRTHPKVAQRDGEAYRDGLVDRARAAGVGDVVELDDRYLDTGELGELVHRADVVLLPYDSREQVTSGVLIEAIAAGRPVVSTAFPHAIELLADGTGIVVPQRDPEALEVALRRVLAEPGLAEGMAAQAARKAPELLWPAVAGRYRGLAMGLVAEALAEAS